MWFGSTDFRNGSFGGSTLREFANAGTVFGAAAAFSWVVVLRRSYGRPYPPVGEDVERVLARRE